MTKGNDDLECTTEGCNLAKEVSKVSEQLETLTTDTKNGFSKFEKKQDTIVEILGEWKSMMTEIRNLKESQQRIDSEIVRDQNGLREDKIAIWNRINELERTKAEKADLKESRGWFWALIILLLTLAFNFGIDLVKKLFFK